MSPSQPQPPNRGKPDREGPSILQVISIGCSVAMTLLVLWRMLPEEARLEIKGFLSDLTGLGPRSAAEQAADEMAEHVEALIDLGRVPGWWDTSRRLDAPSN